MERYRKIQTRITPNTDTFSRNGGVLNFLQALFKYPLKSQNTIDCFPQKNLSFNQQQHRWYDALIGAVYFLYCENIGKCTPA